MKVSLSQWSSAKSWKTLGEKNMFLFMSGIWKISDPDIYFCSAKRSRSQSFGRVIWATAKNKNGDVDETREEANQPKKKCNHKQFERPPPPLLVQDLLPSPPPPPLPFLHVLITFWWRQRSCATLPFPPSFSSVRHVIRNVAASHLRDEEDERRRQGKKYISLNIARRRLK